MSLRSAPSDPLAVRRQVIADDLPDLAVIHTPVDELTSVVDGLCVMRIERDRRIPVDAKIGEGRSPRSNALPLARLEIEPNEIPGPGNGVSVVRLAGIRQDPEAVIRPELRPITNPGATARP